MPLGSDPSFNQQVQDFLAEYNCSEEQAQRAAELSNALLDDNCAKVIAIKHALANNNCHPRFTSSLILKVAVLAIWLYYEDKPFPDLHSEVYPLVSMVLDKTKSNIATQMRFCALSHGDTVPSVLIANVLQEAIQIAENQ